MGAMTAKASHDSGGPTALQTRMTLFSALGYLPRWAKYTLVPDFVRFLWWLVWVRVCAVAHVIHRAAVLQGASVRELKRFQFKAAVALSCICIWPQGQMSSAPSLGRVTHCMANAASQQGAQQLRGLQPQWCLVRWNEQSLRCRHAVVLAAVPQRQPGCRPATFSVLRCL